jgi:hypothetical protein
MVCDFKINFLRLISSYLAHIDNHFEISHLDSETHKAVEVDLDEDDPKVVDGEKVVVEEEKKSNLKEEEVEENKEKVEKKEEEAREKNKKN